MELAFEIPLPHLKEYLSVSCFPFGLAHLMLDQTYKHAGTYHSVMKGCLLDNSMYELKDEPLTIPQLIQAAKVCEPISIIAPDWMDKAHETINATYRLQRELANTGQFTSTRVGGVVQGKDLEERVACFYRLQNMGCKPVCLPFRRDRTALVGHLHARGAFMQTGWYHLLGLQDLWELSWKFPGRWSLDTGKPFKGVKLCENQLRGLGRLDINKELTEKGRRLAFRNIALMRKVAR